MQAVPEHMYVRRLTLGDRLNYSAPWPTVYMRSNYIALHTGTRWTEIFFSFRGIPRGFRIHIYTHG